MKKIYYLFFVIILITIIFIYICIYIYCKSIVVFYNDDIKIDYNIRLNFYVSLNETGLRNIEINPFWFDKFFKKFYRKIIFKKYKLTDLKNISNIINIIPNYATVDIYSDLIRIDNRKEKLLFNYFINNNNEKVNFLEVNNLTINRRILLKIDSAEPVVFYEITVFQIINLFNKRKYNLEKKINFKPDTLKVPIVLGFAGDLVIEEYVKYSIDKYGIQYTFESVNKILEIPDIMSANLEFTISNKGFKEKKHFTFRADEQYSELIFSSPIDYFSLANNHAMDYGGNSLKDTMHYLDKNKKYHSGTGLDIKEAFDPAVIKVKNNSFAYFSICDVPDEINGYKIMKNFKAGKKNPGIAFFDKKIILELFQQNINKIIIVQFHTGNELSFDLSKTHINNAKMLIDMGADAVICHHPHFINGIEIYKNKLIIYSLGNFLFDIQKKYADEGIILFLFIFNNKILSWSFYPVISHYGKVSINEKRISEVEKRFINLSKKINDKYRLR